MTSPVANDVTRADHTTNSLLLRARSLAAVLDVLIAVEPKDFSDFNVTDRDNPISLSEILHGEGRGSREKQQGGFSRLVLMFYLRRWFGGSLSRLWHVDTLTWPLFVSPLPLSLYGLDNTLSCTVDVNLPPTQS